ncbi:GRAM domain-containing protein 2A isoform X6 [Mustela erminea]|uniref:GRAM domain-containing protein 2A isoform X6 n=1 Tax=Mustela erminea TaxID=36723 RepID=UPI0013869B25|nr:GRAM domain-containing protein 2A isoform X6 [Mustela erminea]
MAQESEPFTAAQSGGAPLSRACGRARARPCFQRSQIWASYQVGCWTPIPNGTSDEGALGSFFRRGREVQRGCCARGSISRPVCVPSVQASGPIGPLGGWAGRVGGIPGTGPPPRGAGAPRGAGILGVAALWRRVTPGFPAPAEAGAENGRCLSGCSSRAKGGGAAATTSRLFQDPKTPSNLPCALRRSQRVHKAGVILSILSQIPMAYGNAAQAPQNLTLSAGSKSSSPPSHCAFSSVGQAYLLGATLSDQQMRGKTASLKSSVSCSEKLARVQAPLDSSLGRVSLHWPEGLKGEEIKKCGREGTLLSKYNQQYHKLFKDIPLEEVVLKVCSCALQRDLLLQGRLYISPNWLCFHASLFGKDIKVVIPVVSVQMIKKHKMARLLPNGLAITTNTSQKYVFVSLLSRDSVYDMLRRVCTHLQPSSKKSLSVREFPEEPECESLVRAEEVLIPEMKWRKVCPASRSLSLPDNIPCIPRASMDSTDSFFPRKPPGSENDVCEDEKLEEEPRSDGKLRLWDYQLLKVIFVLICFLVMSSSYLAFRISRLEQQLCSLNWDGPVPGHR